jgi:hypothetical protein
METRSDQISCVKQTSWVLISVIATSVTRASASVRNNIPVSNYVIQEEATSKVSHMRARANLSCAQQWLSVEKGRYRR